RHHEDRGDRSHDKQLRGETAARPPAGTGPVAPRLALNHFASPHVCLIQRMPVQTFTSCKEKPILKISLCFRRESPRVQWSTPNKLHKKSPEQTQELLEAHGLPVNVHIAIHVDNIHNGAVAVPPQQALAL